uniref:Retrotransposon Copia-like N-terminal domain-containing protein n=1 Tax=Tanacetum cinerariifolium TaxID=118510 RepID=A0A6L2KAN5_TANCI|nr:hypothetical protein [Tanacetum cinerariifolium]
MVIQNPNLNVNNPNLNLNTVNNSINHPLYIGNSDQPGVVLTNNPFNGSNFLGWSCTVKMALVQQVEKQKRVTNHVADPVAFFANMNQNKFVKRDTREQCFEKIGRPDWYKEKKNKKGGKLAAKMVFGLKTPFDMGYENELQEEQSNLGLDQKLVVVVCQEVMKMMNGKSYASTSGATPGYGVAHGFMHHAVISFYVRTYALSSQSNIVRINEWIIDTGASDNMCPRITLFKTTHLLKNPITCNLPDGTTKIVTIARQIQLTPTLLLKDVLYVPEFKFTWKTPLEILHGTPPSYEALKTIGCLCYTASLGPNRDKFDPKGIRCVFIGYPPGQQGYKLYNLSSHEVIHSRNVVFQESVFPFKELVTTFVPSSVKPVCYLDLSTDEKVDVPEAPTINPLLDLTTEPIHTHEDNVKPLPNTNQPSNSPQNIPTRRSARSTTTPKWLKDFVGPKSFANTFHQQPLYPLFTHDDFKDVPHNHIAFLANVFDYVEPVSYSSACTHKGWVAAMEKELTALEQNKT